MYKQFIFRSVLILFAILVLSACGGGDDDTEIPPVSLTVALFDTQATAPASGQKVQITAGGDINFTCFQSASQGVTPDSRCGTEAAGSNLSTSSIVFSSLPTGRTYTLKASTDGTDTVRATCTVDILSTTKLDAQIPCTQTATNKIQMDLP